MIEKLRLHGLVKLSAELLPTGEWEVRLSNCRSGQGDVVSRRPSPDDALQGATDLFLQFAKPSRRPAPETALAPAPAKPRRKVTRGWPAPLPDDEDDGSRLI